MIKANQIERNIEENRTPVLSMFCFSNILFIYYCGPFQEARPTKRAITAIVKIITKKAGDVTIWKMLIRLTNNSKNEIPNATKPLLICFSDDKWLNNLARHPVGY